MVVIQNSAKNVVGFGEAAREFRRKIAGGDPVALRSVYAKMFEAIYVGEEDREGNRRLDFVLREDSSLNSSYRLEEVSSTCVEMVDQINPGTGNVLQPKTTVTSSIKTLQVTFNKAVLHQKYVVERLSMTQIAAEFSSSKTGIRTALVRFGISIREKGKSPNRVHSLPFGKRCVNGKVVIHKAEQRAIESVLKMHKEGLSNSAIARVLTEMKIPTKQQGKGWHPEMVRQILLRSQRSET